MALISLPPCIVILGGMCVPNFNKLSQKLQKLNISPIGPALERVWTHG